MEELGKLERLSARQAWPHEAQDFTPWLLANADALGGVAHLNCHRARSCSLVSRPSTTGTPATTGTRRPPANTNHVITPPNRTKDQVRKDYLINGVAGIFN